MAYYYRRRWRAWRPRRYWRRRSRKTFRNRYWRRKRKYRYRVRKRKLKFLKLKEFQPNRIHKLKITGQIPLFGTTNERLINDYTLYANTTVPHYLPGGGGFTIYRFTLNALYELWTKSQNFWTKSNANMPFIRYTGCTFKLFKNESADYIFNYHNCWPMRATVETFHSTQPQIMLMNARHKLVKCRKNNHFRKPYTKVKIPPPTQMTNKWYLQKDFADIPLCLTMASAMSLDRFYLSSTAQSTTIGFTSLNDNIFDFYNYEINYTEGYIPRDKKYMWTLSTQTTNYQQEAIKKLIYLGQSKEWTRGQDISSAMTTTNDFATAWSNYFQSKTKWGNIFDPQYLNKRQIILTSIKSPSELKATYSSDSQWTTGDTKIGVHLTELTLPMVLECRYNPYSDTGNNTVFLVKITAPEKISYHVPDDIKLKTEPYPLWISVWGFTDFEKKLIGPQIDTDYQVVIKSGHITPSQHWYIPIDQEFLEGRSKYRPKDTAPIVPDQLHWHPKTSFQMSSLNNIGSSGPGTIKLPKNISAEAHAHYTFYFKVGSCAAPIQDIENPDELSRISIPNNILQPTSLQNPEYPIEYYLYPFDQRRHIITNKAAKRMQKEYETEKTLSTFTGHNLLDPETLQTAQDSSSEEETEKETLLQLLHQQRVKQQQFRDRILRLLTQTTSTE
nr:MAG: ORF1 [TTV-like mini virus]